MAEEGLLALYGRRRPSGLLRQKTSSSSMSKEDLQSFYGKRRPPGRPLWQKKTPRSSIAEKASRSYMIKGLLCKISLQFIFEISSHWLLRKEDIQIVYERSPSMSSMEEDHPPGHLWKKTYLKVFYVRGPLCMSSVEEDLPTGLLWRKTSVRVFYGIRPPHLL